jgi:hypothetical protein
VNPSESSGRIFISLPQPQKNTIKIITTTTASVGDKEVSPGTNA